MTGRIGDNNFRRRHVEEANTTYVAPKVILKHIPMAGGGGASHRVQSKETVSANIKKVVEQEMKNTGNHYTKEDVEYWSKLIAKNSEASNLPPEVITAIIGRETKFVKNSDGENGGGAMQVILNSCTDMFDDKNGRLSVYNKMDENMMNQILYKCDEDGKPIKDAKGNPVRKYKTDAALREALVKDDDLGIKIGIMCFKMKYAMAARAYTGTSLVDTIGQLKNKSLSLSEAQQKEVLTETLRTYNSVFKSYAPDVVASIQALNPDAISDFATCMQNKRSTLSYTT